KKIRVIVSDAMTHIVNVRMHRSIVINVVSISAKNRRVVKIGNIIKDEKKRSFLVGYDIKFHQVLELPYNVSDLSSLPINRFGERRKAWREKIKSELKGQGGVYYLMEEGVVLYVGRSINIQKRLYTHMVSERLTASVDGIAVQFIDDVPTQSIIEAIAIKEFLPELNVTGKTV
ncbi:hypothetical protein, partial [Halalkalibacter oceani]|uniref:hypothetical protein n=1 Tax=Halalkalibacter oceani TaxID=1653776 RepID=UPI0035F46E6B